MSGIFDLVTQALGQGSVSQLSDQLGTDHGTTQSAVSAALPMLFGAMANHAQTDTGSQQIHNAVTSTAIPPSAPEPAAQPAASDSGLLSKILGAQQSEVQNGVAQASGLDLHQAGKVLMYLAPIVIGVLARKHQEQPQAQPAQQTSGSSGGLAGMLREAMQSAQAQSGSSGGLGGILGSLLG
ncbi:MAG: DUF937 domain-containing protein [Gemmatimonadaceae bacterium]